MSQTGSLSSNALENVVHERVHDRHSLGRDTSVRMNLFQHLVDVDAVALLPPALLLLVTLGNRLLGLASLLGGLSGGFGGHDYVSPAIGDTLPARSFVMGTG